MLFLVSLMLASWAVELEGAENEIIERSDTRRPIWNMGHMVNKIEQINEFLDLGANSIEVDITFDNLGYAEYTYHGFPCDCKRWCTNQENVKEYLNALSDITTPGNPKFREELTLVVFDLKTGGIDANRMYEGGKDFAGKILFDYWKGSENAGRAYIIISVPSIDHYKFMKGFRERFDGSAFKDLLLEKVGWDFSGNDDLDATRTAYQNAGIEALNHIWQSDGITNCIPRGLGRVNKAVSNRDSSDAFINKVYVWTVEKYSSVKDALNADVDGIMTNHPNVINGVLKEDEFKDRFKLATYEDNPWTTFKR